jgi:hypothetical protein
MVERRVLVVDVERRKLDDVRAGPQRLERGGAAGERDATRLAG